MRFRSVPCPHFCLCLPVLLFSLASAFSGPELQMHVSGTNVVLAWPANAIGFRAQSRGELAADNWDDLGSAPSVLNAEQRLLVPRTNAHVFFRLFKDSGTNPAITSLSVSTNALSLDSTGILQFDFNEPDLDLAGLALTWTNVLGSFTNILSAQSVGITDLLTHAEFPIRPDKLPFGTSYFTLWLVDRMGLYSEPVEFQITIVGTGGLGTAPQLSGVLSEAPAWRPGFSETWKLNPGFAVSWSDAESDVARVRAVLRTPSGVDAVREIFASKTGMTNSGGSAMLRPFTLTHLDWWGTYEAEFQLIDRTGRTSAVRSVSFQLDDSAPASPQVTGFFPSSGVPGSIAYLMVANADGLGTNFQVTLAGVPCPVITNDFGYLTMLVPTGAVTAPFKLFTASEVSASTTPFVVPPFILLTANRDAAAPGEAVQFSTFVRGATNRLVTFAVNGVAGGNAAVGLISGGLYRLPELPPTNLMTITAMLVTQPGISATALVQVLPRTSLGGTNWISAGQGGSVNSVDGSAALDVPPGALATNALVSIAIVDGTNLPAPAAGRRLLGAVRLAPSGLVFNQPVTLTLPLLEARPPGSVLPLKYYNRPTGSFIDEGVIATVASNGRQASAEILHFSEAMLDDAETPPNGPPQISGLLRQMDFQEGLTVPVLITGQNLVPGLRVEIWRNGQLTDDVVASGAIFETNRAGVLLTVRTLRDLGLGMPRDYELRLVNSANEWAGWNLPVSGLDELFISPGVHTNVDSSLQVFSEVEVGAGAVLNASGGLRWLVNGPVRMAGRIGAHGQSGESSHEDGPGVNGDFSEFTLRGANGGNPDLPGHDAFLQLSARGDFHYGEGGAPGEDISSIETFFEALFNLWSCISGDFISCGEFVANVIEIVGDFADMEAGKAIGRPGLPGARASFDLFANSGRGGGGGGGGGDLNWLDEGEYGGAGGNGGRGVFILTRSDMWVNGLVETRGGDGGDGGENIVTIYENTSLPFPIEDTPSANRGGGGGGGSGGNIMLIGRNGFGFGPAGGVDARGGHPGNSLTTFRTVDASTGMETARRSVRFVDAKYPFTPSGRITTRGLPVDAQDLPDLVTRYGLLRLHLPPLGHSFGSTVTITIRGENTNQVRVAAFTADSSGVRNANLLFFPGFNTIWIDDDGIPDHPVLHRNALYLAGPDSDGDGLSDADEAQLGTDSQAADTDGDGLNDLDELLAGLSPITGDSDGDLISDPDELSGGTDPRSRDSDQDGFWDGWELQAGRSPLLAQPTIGALPPGTLFAEVGSSVNGRVLAIVDPAASKLFAIGRVNSGLGFGVAFNAEGSLLGVRGNQLVRVLLDQPADITGQLAVTSIGYLTTNGPAIYCYSLASSPFGGKLLGIESTAQGDSTGQFLEIDTISGLATRVGLMRPNPLHALAVFGSGSAQEALFASSEQPGTADSLESFSAGISNAPQTVALLNGTNVYGLTPASPDRLYAARTDGVESALLLVNATNGTQSMLGEFSGALFDLALSPCPAPCLNGPYLSTLTFLGMQFETADFNGDTRPDLAVAVTRTIGNEEFAGITILHGQGNSQFTNSGSYFFDNARDISAPHFALGDVNADGRLDIVMVQPAVIVGFFQTLLRPAEIMVLLANNQGGFQPPIIHSMAMGSPMERMAQVTAADWSGDGRADLIFVNESQRTYTFQGTGTGLFTNAIELLPALFQEVALLADVNADGDPDFIGAGSSGVNVRLADGAGGFTANQFYDGSGRHINTADVDGDGDQDLVVTDYGAVPRIYYNSGTGTFPTNATFNPRTFPNGVYARAALGDLSGDGLPDVVVPSTGQNLTAFISGIMPATLAHTMIEPLSAPFPCGGTASSVLILDVNNDSHPDVVALIGHSISVMLGEPSF
ncbi:MAG TPA: FG-GAP-like repeat-containing protein [Verrucomicrobiae bacterium]|nr:FG-GAP-like repeat-containing protein [Verrucomicrobiae bacterium]